MRVLVVEDDQRVASFIQKGLEQEGLAVDGLHDGRVVPAPVGRAVDVELVGRGAGGVQLDDGQGGGLGHVRGRR